MLLITGKRVTGIKSSLMDQREALSLMAAMRRAGDQSSIKDIRSENKNVVFSYGVSNRSVHGRFVISDGSNVYVITGGGDHSVKGDMKVFNVTDVFDTLLGVAKLGFTFAAFKRPRDEVNDNAEWLLVDKDFVISEITKTVADAAKKTESKRKPKDKTYSYQIGSKVSQEKEDKKSVEKKPTKRRSSKVIEPKPASEVSNEGNGIEVPENAPADTTQHEETNEVLSQ